MKYVIGKLTYLIYNSAIHTFMLWEVERNSLLLGALKMVPMLDRISHKLTV